MSQGPVQASSGLLITKNTSLGILRNRLKLITLVFFNADSNGTCDQPFNKKFNAIRSKDGMNDYWPCWRQSGRTN